MNLVGSLHKHQSQEYAVDTEKTNSNVASPDRSRRSILLQSVGDLISEESVDLSMPENVPIANLPLCPQFKSFRSSLYLLFSDPTSSKLAFTISIIITTLIIASCVTFILESMPEYKYPRVGNNVDDTLPFFVSFELIAIITFTIEYCLRLLTAHSVDYPELGYKRPDMIDKQKNSCCCSPLYKTWLFIRQPFNIIDLLAILPFYVSVASNHSSSFSKFSFIRILRLARVFRVFKLGKYTEGVVVYSQVFRKSAEALYLLLLFSLITSVVMGSFIYFFEKGEWTENGCQDHETATVYSCFARDNILGTKQEESPYYSIPQSIWWVFTTITTVGYGDIFPTSLMGKIIAIITMHVGILGIALPISIIGANFREIYDIRQQRKSDLKMKTRLTTCDSDGFINEIETLDEIRNAIKSIVLQVNALQVTMKHYEELVKEQRFKRTITVSRHQRADSKCKTKCQNDDEIERKTNDDIERDTKHKDATSAQNVDHIDNIVERDFSI